MSSGIMLKKHGKFFTGNILAQWALKFNLPENLEIDNSC